MKKLLSVLILAIIGLTAMAQSATESELIRAYFKVTKMAIFEESMGLTEEQGTQFWPLYKKYEEEAAKLNDFRIKYLTDYVDNFENITDEQVDALLKGANSYNKKMAALKTKYYKQIKKTLGSGLAMRFLQIEEYIQTVIKYEILDTLPFVGDEM